MTVRVLDVHIAGDFKITVDTDHPDYNKAARNVLQGMIDRAADVSIDGEPVGTLGDAWRKLT